MAKSARVEGDIIHEQLSIEAGAYLDGYCRRMEAPTRTGLEMFLTACSAEMAECPNQGRSLPRTDTTEPAKVFSHNQDP